MDPGQEEVWWGPSVLMLTLAASTGDMSSAYSAGEPTCTKHVAAVVHAYDLLIMACHGLCSMYCTGLNQLLLLTMSIRKQDGQLKLASSRRGIAASSGSLHVGLMYTQHTHIYICSLHFSCHDIQARCMLICSQIQCDNQHLGIQDVRLNARDSLFERLKF